MSLLELYLGGAAFYVAYCLLSMDAAQVRHDSSRGREAKQSARKEIDCYANRLAMTPIWPYTIVERVYRLLRWR